MPGKEERTFKQTAPRHTALNFTIPTWKTSKEAKFLLKRESREDTNDA